VQGHYALVSCIYKEPPKLAGQDTEVLSSAMLYNTVLYSNDEAQCRPALGAGRWLDPQVLDVGRDLPGHSREGHMEEGEVGERAVRHQIPQLHIEDRPFLAKLHSPALRCTAGSGCTAGCWGRRTRRVGLRAVAAVCAASAALPWKAEESEAEGGDRRQEGRGRRGSRAGGGGEGREGAAVGEEEEGDEGGGGEEGEEGEEEGRGRGRRKM